MALVLTSPSDYVNAALGRIGYQKRIGNIYEGSRAAAASLDIYGQTRDELLRKFEWGFAERNLTLTLLKTAPVGGYGTTAWSTTYPILPWIYEYGYPDDCLKIRSLRTTPAIIPQYDPSAVPFRIANDNAYSPAKKVILTNLESAIAVYTGQVTDMTTWEPDFAEALIAELGRRLAPALSSLEAEKAEAQDEAVAVPTAEMRIG